MYYCKALLCSISMFRHQTFEKTQTMKSRKKSEMTYKTAVPVYM